MCDMTHSDVFHHFACVVCMYVCVCVCERERVYVYVCVCVCVCNGRHDSFILMCDMTQSDVFVCVCVCERVCVYV